MTMRIRASFPGEAKEHVLKSTQEIMLEWDRIASVEREDLSVVEVVIVVGADTMALEMAMA
jgi:hypothetical protein